MWHWNLIDDLEKQKGTFFYPYASFMHHFVAIDESKLELQFWNAHFGSKSAIFVPCNLVIWWMNLKNNWTPLLTDFKLCAPFRSHCWIQTGATVLKRQICVKIGDFLSLMALKFAWWPWKNIMAPLLCYFKIFASFHSHHLWIHVGVMVWKKNKLGKICSNLCDLDLWPLILTFCMGITFVHRNNSWKFMTIQFLLNHGWKYWVKFHIITNCRHWPLGEIHSPKKHFEIRIMSSSLQI